VIFASGRQGWATTDLAKPNTNMQPVFDAIIKHIPAPKANEEAPLQMLVTTLDYSDYVGRIAIGRIFAGSVAQAQKVTVIDNQGNHTLQKIIQLYTFDGLGKKHADVCEAGDICAIAGLDPIDIGNTIACADEPSSLPIVAVDEPTMNMTFRVNDGPFAGRDGKYVTSRHIKERLDKELKVNVALRVDPGQTADEFMVSGRGLLHLGILLENMRREGYEMTVGKPQVIVREVNGIKQEPIEMLVVECPSDCQSAVMCLLGDRRSELVSMDAKTGADNFIHMEFRIPSRGLFGLHARLLTATQGRAVMHHNFERYEPLRGSIPQRQAGVMIATDPGIVTAYALDALFDRGTFFVEPQEQVYEGQIVGEHCKDNDIPVNAVKAKQLTNMRAAGKDDNARVKAARRLSLEPAMEYIQEDELVEITPKFIRLRKRLLKEADRKRDARKKQS
jgi:GTP-binding protein